MLNCFYLRDCIVEITKIKNVWRTFDLMRLKKKPLEKAREQRSEARFTRKMRFKTLQMFSWLHCLFYSLDLFIRMTQKMKTIHFIRTVTSQIAFLKGKIHLEKTIAFKSPKCITSLKLCVYHQRIFVADRLKLQSFFTILLSLQSEFKFTDISHIGFNGLAYFNCRHRERARNCQCSSTVTIDGYSHINNDNNNNHDNNNKSECIFQDIFHLMPCDDKFHLHSLNIIARV